MLKFVGILQVSNPTDLIEPDVTVLSLKTEKAGATDPHNALDNRAPRKYQDLLWQFFGKSQSRLFPKACPSEW